jgi:hypothetical protein
MTNAMIDPMQAAQQPQEANYGTDKPERRD